MSPGLTGKCGCDGSDCPLVVKLQFPTVVSNTELTSVCGCYTVVISCSLSLWGMTLAPKSNIYSVILSNFSKFSEYKSKNGENLCTINVCFSPSYVSP